ncbi:MAG: hypothetical protein FWG35_05960 [Spirochaetaceae bacterium]|nr:hypothetical protein [Spirochaetaceae bacterium]
MAHKDEKGKIPVGKTPDQGFFFRSTKPHPGLAGSDKAALVRRGNEFFNNGNLAAAKRVFLTTGYGDGLIRMGDHHYHKKEFLEAFRMYWLGKEKRKCDELIEKMVFVIREWLEEDSPPADDAGREK